MSRYRSRSMRSSRFWMKRNEVKVGADAGGGVRTQAFLYDALRSAVALRVVGRRSCAAFGCGSSLVAASGGQGGIGGLRVPPTPSLDSLLTPLYRRRSARGLEAAERRGLTRRAGVGAQGLDVMICGLSVLCGFWGALLRGALALGHGEGVLGRQNFCGRAKFVHYCLEKGG